jgi:hypothetical protein
LPFVPGFENIDVLELLKNDALRKELDKMYDRPLSDQEYWIIENYYASINGLFKK